MTDTTRAEHLAFCKERALEYVKAGELENAVTSMMSDLSKHDGTRGISGHARLMLHGLMMATEGNRLALIDWINGFN